MTVTVSSTNHTYRGSLTSPGILIEKAVSPIIPQTSEVLERTDTSILISTVPGQEYSLDGVNWQTTGSFSDLEPLTTYVIYTRTAETAGYLAGDIIEAVTVTTDHEPWINPFTDVSEDAYYYDAVLWGYNSDPPIIAGTSETTFSPNKPCTRAQVITFLWHAYGSSEPGISATPFDDISEDAYYYKAVLWAYENGITSGTSESTFSPNSYCTRAQVVTFLWRAAGKPAPTIESTPFEDISDGYYYQAVLWAYENHITTGTSECTFSPKKICTRAHVATFLYVEMFSSVYN